MRTAKEFFSTYYDIVNHIRDYNEREAMREKLFSDWYHEMEVGDHAHVTLWSDVEPVTIVKKTATTLTVRYDNATLDPNWKPEFIIGGFSAHCTNNEDQQWIITENPDGKTEVFRWSKRFNCYKNPSDCKLRPEWRKHYDYNF